MIRIINTAIAVFLFTALAYAGNPKTTSALNIDISVKGDNVTLTWQNNFGEATFNVYSAEDVNNSGDLNFTSLAKIDGSGKYALTFKDSSNKDKSLIYYKISVVSKTGEQLSSEVRTVNFINKDKFISNLKPDFSMGNIGIEINCATKGMLKVDIKSLNGKYEINKTMSIEKGYNNLYVNIDNKLESGMYMVTLSLNGFSDYKMIDYKQAGQLMLSSDE